MTAPIRCPFCDRDPGVHALRVDTPLGTVYACRQCLARLVRDELAAQADARQAFCRGCPQYSGRYPCAAGVTPETCA